LHVAKKPYKPQEVITKTADKIKSLRIGAGYKSYEVFALDNDLDRKQYWRAENGANLTLKSLIKILNIHKISISEFYREI
jgi:hypothetical protein